MDSKLRRIYDSPKGYWIGIAAVKNLSKAANVTDAAAEACLKRQAFWQIYLAPLRYIPHPKFDEECPNTVHQADLLLLPHDRVGRKTYKYALTVIDVARQIQTSGSTDRQKRC